jgi:hypothetical protein
LQRLHDLDGKSETWHDSFTGRRELLCGDDEIVRLQVTAYDLGKAVVV